MTGTAVPPGDGGSHLSVFDLFSVGIGPSSSHTVGPMRAARRFVEELDGAGVLRRTGRIRTELFGSLGATGRGHGSDTAVLLGLSGEIPEQVDVAGVGARLAAIRAAGTIELGGRHRIGFDERRDLVLHRRRALPVHPNTVRFTSYDGAGEQLVSRDYCSVGGGFVVTAAELSAHGPSAGLRRYPFATAVELLERAGGAGGSISAVALAHELEVRTAAEVRAGLLRIWGVMQECVRAGCRNEGMLPGGLKVRRRAPQLHRALHGQAEDRSDPLRGTDWVALFALAVNEENAAGGRVVTAPTNGAAGIVPAVLHYYRRFVPGADDDGVVRFLLVAGAIAMLFTRNASISGAEVGCQGEVGSACAMAAAGLTEVLGGTPEQVENAAEIALEHNLGLTCDPVGGLVQIPCIERNAVAAVKAITAARLALRSDGTHHVPLDAAITTMREIGADMKSKYKETSRGGLAVNVVIC